MTKLDPIIAVKDVNLSVAWYQSIFGCKRTHGGYTFAVLVAENDEVLLCLHKWGAHEHPTMADPTSTPSNGLILYFKTENLNSVRQKVEKEGYAVEEELHLNANSGKMEFALRDPDDYYIIVTESHNYEGEL